MKKLFVFIATFISSVSFSQRDAIDAKNIEKVNEVHNTVINLLTGAVSEKDIVDLGNFIYANKPKNDEIIFLSLLNPSLYTLNEDPNQKIDNVYLTESFRVLVGKTNVKIELESVEDYYDFIDHSIKSSDYMLTYKISFKDNNSIGNNVDNYIMFHIDIVDCEILNIIHQIRYI